MLITYTSIQPDSILKLTYKQFKVAVDGVAKKMALDIKLAVATLDPDALKENPFEEVADEEKVFRLSDAQSLMALANS